MKKITLKQASSNFGRYLAEQNIIYGNLDQQEKTLCWFYYIKWLGANDKK